MAKQQFNPILKKLLRNAQQLDRKLTANQRFWLLRSGFLTQEAEGGFILPTVTLLLLMLSLVLGLLIFRTGTRTNQVITERQQRQIYNATTPAIERAKAKLEFLFTNEALPALPSEESLTQALQNDGIQTGPNGDYGRYTLKDETRVDINGDGNKDNAWTFQFDANGDGTEEITVGYSILTRSSSALDPNNPNQAIVEIQDPDDLKAADLVVRNSPINITDVGGDDCPDPGLSPFKGWQTVTGSSLRKSIQVHAFAQNPTTGVVSTLEMQQDKQASLGNKWGAWFRNDMEIFPGPPFNWNGAMYVAGSYFIGDSTQVKLYPISSPSSCVYRPENSEILMGVVDADILEESPEVNGGREFEGQFVAASLKTNTFAGGPTLYQHSEAKGQIPPANRITDIRDGNDSVDGGTPDEIALDPVLLITKGQNQTRGGGVDRDGAWEGKWWVGEGRLYNAYQPTPFVDDTYRADDRWGPKPIYSEQPLAKVPNGINIADPNDNSIKSDPALATTDPSADLEALNVPEDEQRLIRNSPPKENATDEESYGLDGYWERRAKAQGVRIIVGQRLELGNTHGWATELDSNGNGTLEPEEDLNGNGLLDFDPLYPPPANAAAGSSMANRAHEQRQWKTLRDNAAAAQSTTLYHYLMDEGQYPVACIASTAHPGTPDTIEKSTEFKGVNGNASKLNVDFLTGTGTNGWEFYPPQHATSGAATSDSLATARVAFATEINNQDSDLRDALHNLAYFAGDPNGAFPPLQEGGNSDIVHPYPIQSMWGDFSNLRRVIDKLEGNGVYGTGAYYGSTGAKYEQLSLADQTTLQTASCTLGMLAYNIDNIQNHPDALTSDGEEEKLGTVEFISAIRSLEKDGKVEIDGNDIGQPFNLANPAASALKAEDVIAELRRRGGPELTDAQLDTLEAVTRRQQILRDRSLGFSQGMIYKVTDGFGNARVLGQQIFGGTEIRLQCDFIANDYFGLGQPKDAKKENQFLTLALTLCPSQPKYPSLAYLFPIRDHAHDGELANDSDLENGGTLKPEQIEAFRQPESEPYTSDNLLVNGNRFDNAYTINNNPVGNDLFRVIGDDNDDGILESNETDFASIILQPKEDFTNWAQPQVASPVSPNPDDENRINKITYDFKNTSGDRWLAFLDKGIFNGRDAMVARVTDIDLDLLRETVITGKTPAKSTTASDWWLPLPDVLDSNQAPTSTGAAIYAFREDTIREDGIARPSGAEMDAVSAQPSDPPVNPDNGISAKAVDYHPDPDRRIHGFRLRNGIDLRRVGTTTSVKVPREDIRGMSFISDNPVYVQGHFNIHSAESGEVGDIIQEFKGAKGILEAGWGPKDFYERTDRDKRFARPKPQTAATPDEVGDGDSWRATEVAGDSVTLLSSNFSGTEEGKPEQDGWIAQGIMGGNGSFNNNSSFRALNRPNGGTQLWVREDGMVSDDVNYSSPIKISQRGFPVYCVGGTNGASCVGQGGQEIEYGLSDGGGFRAFATDRAADLVQALPDTYMNMLMVSGTIPSRAQQSNGGLHNFPRFLESFAGSRMWIAGSIYQINFSNTATGPFDQDSWEPGSGPIGNELIKYYEPPNRLWGYDPALQLVPPAPIARRFATPANIRSEFYKELPVDDPYIVNLRCAVGDESAKNQGLCN